MSRTDGDTDADLDRILPRYHPHDADHPGGNGKPFSIFLRLEPGQRRRSLQPIVPGHRSCRHRLTGLSAAQLRVASSCRRFDVHHDQDDGDSIPRRAATVATTHHAVDDAGDDRCLHLPIPSWTGNLYIAVEHRRCGNPVLCRRTTTHRPVRKTVSGHSRNASSSISSQS